MQTPPFRITSKILNLVAEISAKIERYAIELEQDTSLHLRKANRIKTIHSSLAIEGNALTENQVRDIINGKNVIAPVKEIQEVKNAIATYDIFPLLNPFDEKDLLRAHRTMMESLVDNPGQWRRCGVGVFGETGCVHLAPPADRVAQLMSELFAWVKNADDHLLIRSCVFHYEFEFIHPFLDGNGRIGRLWQSLLLSRLHPLFAHLPVENMVHSNQQAYYDAITASNSAGESTPFIEFMLGEILETLSAHQGQEKHDYDIADSPLDREFGTIFGNKFGIKFGIKFGDNDKKVLLLMNSNPSFSSQNIANRLEITKRGVEKIIKRLREFKVIERIGSNKTGYWKVNRIDEKS
ncbi:MAG: Fic family protein [Muribaculaceae bacterium]|nr:Fic family protein [Muribaculaceae bacterium]